jgi:hypothetical protein
MAIFALTNGITFLTVNAAAAGVNFVFTNPDWTFTTIFLTTSQVRQIGQAVAFALSTGFVNTTVGTITVSVTPPPQASGFPALPITGVVISAPLSGSGAGITWTNPLPLDQARLLATGCNQYSVTNP